MSGIRPSRSKAPEVITLPYNFEPREYQYPVLRYYDEMPNRQRAFLLAHRRTGKDLLAWNILIKETQKRVGTYWHVLPLLNQARKIIWTGSTKDGIPFLDFIPPPLIASKRDDDMSIRLTNGSLIQLVGADRIDSLMGSNPVGVNLSEFALMKPSVWDYLSPILNENDGWANFITTPRGRNHAFDLFKSMVDAVNNKGARYFIQVLTVDDTRKPLLDSNGKQIYDKQNRPIMVPVITPEAIQEQRDLNVPEEIIQQEYYCVPGNAHVACVSGVLEAEKIDVSTLLLTHTGYYEPVERVFKRWYRGDIYKIYSRGFNQPLVVTPNHPVRVVNPSTQSYSWVLAENIEVGHYLTTPRRTALKPLSAPAWSVLLAWYISDGSIQQRAVEFTIGVSELENKKRIIEAARDLGYEAHEVLDKSNKSVVKIFIYSKHLRDLITKWCGAGSKNKRIPFDIIAGHEDIFMEELLKGDGSKYDGYSVYTTVSPSLAYDVQQLAIMLGKKASVSRYEKPKKSHINGRAITSNHEPFRIYIPDKTHEKGIGARIGLARLCQYGAVYKIEKEPYDNWVYNFKVRNDESYVVNGRVVHNCSFEAGMVGAYYSEAIAKLEKEGRAVRDLKMYDPKKPVYTAWDIGFSDSMAIWYFQIDKKKIKIIEYNEFVGKSLIECCYIVQGQWDKLRTECNWDDDQVSRTSSMYAHHEEYTYKTHFGPHDLDQTDISIGVTRRSVAKKHGIKFKLVPRTDVQSGIDLVRRVLINCWFEITRTNDGLRALKEYHKEWNEQKQMYDDKPCHDWSSHGCLVAGTKVLTPEGYKNIEDFRPGDKVAFPGGYTATVSNSGKVKDSETITVLLSTGEEITCSPEHKFFTTRGLVLAEDLCYDDIIATERNKVWQHLLKSTTTLREKVSYVTKELNIGGGLKEDSMFLKEVEKLQCFTDYCIGMGISPMKYILWMGIGKILVRLIGETEEEEHTTIQQKESTKNSTTKNSIEKITDIGGVKHMDQCTDMCGNSIMAQFLKDTMYITKTETQETTLSKIWSLWKYRSIYRSTLKKMLGWVVKKIKNNCDKQTSNVGRIIELRKSATKVPVYDITVEGHHCYYAEGMLTSNSDGFRYLAQSVVTFIDKEFSRKTADEAEHKYNPLEERIKKYDERDDEEERRPRGRIKRNNVTQYALSDYDILGF